jgi:hypothetical protein
VRKLFLSLLFALALAAPGEAFAQAQTQQLSTRSDSGGFASTVNGTTQQTATITPQSGQYVYVTGVDFENCSSASAGAAGTPVFATSTNLGGIKWGIPTSVPAGSCVVTQFYYNPPLKSSTQGAPATVISPAAETNVTYNTNLYGYAAN